MRFRVVNARKRDPFLGGRIRGGGRRSTDVVERFRSIQAKLSHRQSLPRHVDNPALRSRTLHCATGPMLSDEAADLRHSGTRNRLPGFPSERRAMGLRLPPRRPNHELMGRGRGASIRLGFRARRPRSSLVDPPWSPGRSWPCIGTSLNQAGPIMGRRFDPFSSKCRMRFLFRPKDVRPGRIQ